MRDFFLSALEQLRKLWQALEPSQKITIVLLSALVIISLFFIGIWGSRPDFETLYSGLEGADASEVIAKLGEAGVPYKIGAGGSSIMVPKKHVYEMRIQMAASGLPKGGGLGYEIFDNFKLGATDFTQKINYQRALQTELERTISQLGQIRQARVHIAIPDEQLFADEKQYTTASVVLDFIGVTPLSNKQVQGIVHLIASSVKGLSPENITIIDTNGNLLYNSSDPMGSTSGGGFSSVQIEAQSMYERAVERRIQSMLISVLGPNKSVVRVSAELDFDRQTVDSEIYEPSEDPIPRSERLIEESYKGTGKNSQGVPGTASNIPGVKSSGSNSDSKYSRLEEVKNYEVTKRIKHEVKSPGQVRRLSVAVIIDRKIDQEQTDSLAQIVQAAVGINEERGDSLVIKNLDFDNSHMEKQLTEMDKEKQLNMILSIAKAVGTSIFVLIFIIFLYNAIKKIPGSVGAGGRGGPARDLAMEEEFADIEDERYKLEKEVELELEKMEKLSLPTAEAKKKAVMQKKLENEIRTNTGEFVRLLRSWLAED